MILICCSLAASGYLSRDVRYWSCAAGDSGTSVTDVKQILDSEHSTVIRDPYGHKVLQVANASAAGVNERLGCFYVYLYGTKPQVFQVRVGRSRYEIVKRVTFEGQAVKFLRNHPVTSDCVSIFSKSNQIAISTRGDLILIVSLDHSQISHIFKVGTLLPNSAFEVNNGIWNLMWLSSNDLLLTAYHKSTSDDGYELCVERLNLKTGKASFVAWGVLEAVLRNDVILLGRQGSAQECSRLFDIRRCRFMSPEIAGIFCCSLGSNFWMKRSSFHGLNFSEYHGSQLVAGLPYQPAWSPPSLPDGTSSFFVVKSRT